MSDRDECVISELPYDYVRRMRNWASTSAESGLYSISSVYIRERCDGWETSMPVIIGEASDTHAALEVLPLRFLQAVQLYWQNEGKGLRWLGRRLAVDDKTAKARVLKGSELHQAEILRRSEVYHRMVESNAQALANASFNHSRTGSIMVRKQVGVDTDKIPQ